MAKRKQKAKRQQPADDAAPLKDVLKNPDWYDQLINPSLGTFKSELQYDAGAWLAERESDENLKKPFDLMITFALVCARHVSAILLLLRDLKGLCNSGRSSFTERRMLCNGLYVLSAVNQRLRSLPDDEWKQWPKTRGSHCFEVKGLSTLLALDVFCTEIEVAAFEYVFRWVWSVTRRPVDCDPVLSVIGNAVKDAGISNFIQWSHKFNLNIFMESELFPWQGDCRVPEMIPDECDPETELDRVMLELEFEHHEAMAKSLLDETPAAPRKQPEASGNKTKRKSKSLKIAIIAAYKKEHPEANSPEIAKSTGINESDVRHLWKSIKKALREGKRDRPVIDKKTGEAIDVSASCSICRMPLSEPFECKICKDIITGECKTCHYTNTHPDDATP